MKKKIKRVFRKILDKVTEVLEHPVSHYGMTIDERNETIIPKVGEVVFDTLTNSKVKLVNILERPTMYTPSGQPIKNTAGHVFVVDHEWLGGERWSWEIERV